MYYENRGWLWVLFEVPKRRAAFGNSLIFNNLQKSGLAMGWKIPCHVTSFLVAQHIFCPDAPFHAAQHLFLSRSTFPCRVTLLAAFTKVLSTVAGRDLLCGKSVWRLLRIFYGQSWRWTVFLRWKAGPMLLFKSLVFCTLLNKSGRSAVKPFDCFVIDITSGPNDSLFSYKIITGQGMAGVEPLPHFS